MLTDENFKKPNDNYIKYIAVKKFTFKKNLYLKYLDPQTI